MCGARIGCVISKNNEFIKTVLKFAQARLSPPTVAQIASIAALDEGDEYFIRVIGEYDKRRKMLISELKKIKGIKVSEPKGAFYCVLELPVKNSEDFAKWLLEEFDIDNETVMIAPAAGFYSTKRLGLNQVRIAYVLNEKDLKKSIKIIKKGLTEYCKNEF